MPRNPATPSKTAKHKLIAMKTYYRSRQNKVFAGVCGGLSEYTGIDPLLIRLIFVISALIGGVGFGIYLLLWICAPLRDNDYDENVEDTTYDEVREEPAGQAESHTASNDNETPSGEGAFRTGYERDHHCKRDTQTGNPYRKQTNERPSSGTAKKNNTDNSWAILFGIILFLLGLFWLGEMLGLLHFNFRALFKLWPVVLCFAGLNIIPLPKALRIIFNFILIIAIILLIIYVGIHPIGTAFDLCHFNCCWD